MKHKKNNSLLHTFKLLHLTSFHYYVIIFSFYRWCDNFQSCLCLKSKWSCDMPGTVLLQWPKLLSSGKCSQQYKLPMQCPVITSYPKQLWQRHCTLGLIRVSAWEFFLFFSSCDDVFFLDTVVAFVILVALVESRRWSCVLGLFSVSFKKDRETSIFVSEEHLFVWRRSEQTQKDLA